MKKACDNDARIAYIDQIEAEGKACRKRQRNWTSRKIGFLNGESGWQMAPSTTFRAVLKDCPAIHSMSGIDL